MTNETRWIRRSILTGSLIMGTGALIAQEAGRPSSYAPVDLHEAFGTVMARMSAAKPEIEQRQKALLEERYDMSNRPVPGVTMSRNKPIQQGVRVKLPAGITWDELAKLTPDQIKARNIFPTGFLPLPHPNHPEGGMLFPKSEIEEMKKQENRDLTRFDLDFDIPDHFLPEFPPPMYLTTRPDLGDVSKGKLVTLDNYYELFNGILNPKQIEGLRLLLTVFPQQQYNQTEDRRTEHASREGSLPGLPCQRSYEPRYSPGRRHPAPGIPAPHHYTFSSRRKHRAPFRFPACAENCRGLYRV
jgi:cytochrome c peroxidase